MTLLLLHLDVNWQVFTINGIFECFSSPYYSPGVTTKVSADCFVSYIMWMWL